MKTDLVVDEYLLDSEEFDFSKNIIRISFREEYHHAGTLDFDKNDKLYLTTGDGGPQNDPFNEAQNDNSLRGKLLQINPDTKETKIIAKGLRNPWRFSIDDNGRFFIGNVGLGSLEMVYLMENLNKKYNFGWSYYEGSKENKPGKPFSDFDPPIFEYPRRESQGISVIGGSFINKNNIYFFADYLGFLKAIQYNDNNKKWEQVGIQKLDTGERIYSIGYKDDDNIFIMTDKQIYKVIINEIK